MLTDRQAAVLQFVRDFIGVRKKPPTVREIQAHFEWASPNSAMAHLAALERKGYIQRTSGESRNIELLNRCTNRSDAPSAVE